MARKRPSYYRARESFVTQLGDEQVSVKKGELVHPDHAILKGREAFFEPTDTFGRFDVEQATASPGERRGERVGAR
jgi:hypothetical protein